jgi:hypothetical protein
MMRALVLFAFIMCAAPAVAAPICQDRAGNPARCGAAGAMPLGWTAPEEDRHIARANRADVISAVAIVVLLMALIGLLPDFKQEQWDDSDDPKA